MKLRESNKRRKNQGIERELRIGQALDSEFLISFNTTCVLQNKGNSARATRGEQIEE
jgi:hypothetical protein